MKKKIDPRIPNDAGKGALESYAALHTPWEKLVSFYDAYYYECRHKAIIAANFMQVARIMIPDYAERNQRICEVESRWAATMFAPPLDKYMKEGRGVHPFIEGGNNTAFFSDVGDEELLMYGRVNDYGTYRIEKELDCCAWDIVGSECCRASMMTTQQMANLFGDPPYELNMVEARGCGNLHCRVVAENREKYPLPESEGKPIWECLGPIATSDQIKYTPEEKMIKDPQFFREECDYQYNSPLCLECTPAEAFLYQKVVSNGFLGCNYTNNMLVDMIKTKDATYEQIANVVKCVFEASGKTAFGDFYAIKGLRDWLGVPADVNDGRVLGALIELIMQARKVDLKVIAFNKEEVIYELERTRFEPYEFIALGYISMWNGMAKTVISAQWACWEEKTDDVPEGWVRVKIAKRIDKYC